jgi:hypothetical protein
MVTEGEFMKSLVDSELEPQYEIALGKYKKSGGWVPEFFEGFVENVVKFLTVHEKAHVAVVLRTFGRERQDFIDRCAKGGLIGEDGGQQQVTFGAFADSNNTSYSMGLADEIYDYVDVYDVAGKIKFKGERKIGDSNGRGGFHPTDGHRAHQYYAEQMRSMSPNFDSYVALTKTVEKYAFSKATVSPKHKRLHFLFGRDTFAPWNQGHGKGGKPYVIRSPKTVATMGGVPTIGIFFDDNMQNPDAKCGSGIEDNFYIASVAKISDDGGKVSQVKKPETDLEKTQLVWMTGWDAHDKAAYFTSAMDKAIDAYNAAGVLGEDVALYKFNSAT